MLGTYVVSGKLPVEQAFPFGDAAFYSANRVTTHLNSAVTHLDAESRELTTAAGDTYRYERCLVASGARPAVPPITGLREAVAAGAANGGQRVFTLQTLDDALALKRAAGDILGRRPAAGGGAEAGGAAGTPPRAAVVGASFAGIKIAEVLHGLGFRVVLIEREASILPLAAHPDAARIMEAHLLSEGYELRLGAALAGVRLPESLVEPGARMVLDFGALPGAADPGGAGGTACDDSAAQDEVDVLVVCTGNRPALGFLAPGQVDMGTGILVDDADAHERPGSVGGGRRGPGQEPALGAPRDHRPVVERPLPGPGSRPEYGRGALRLPWWTSSQHHPRRPHALRERRLRGRLRPNGHQP